ncbi:hypothetical protein FF80_02541 [Devosia sp. LC5]|uniref:hypothetical protein n=1 Tax=Devosia sp. LC5 TaxID=1502724 RepID=UPI0004E31AEE|nr:hypothetical protein [Devosia sp. LC5]KFC66280.1 hypothetical protein FF80_02541 [Devosia sp. LC5]
MKTVAVLVGSLSPDSINRKLTRTLEKLAGGKLKFDYANLGGLPHPRRSPSSSSSSPLSRG